MQNLNRLINKKHQYQAYRLGLKINAFYCKSAASPRTWKGASSLISSAPVTSDLFSKDETFPFILKNAQGVKLTCSELVEQYCSYSGLCISDYIWIPVYFLRKKGRATYSWASETGSELIGFMIRTKPEYQYLPDAPNAYYAEEYAKIKMQEELVFLDRWQKGQLITVTLSDKQGVQVKRVDNIEGLEYLNARIGQILPQFEIYTA